MRARTVTLAPERTVARRDAARMTTVDTVDTVDAVDTRGWLAPGWKPAAAPVAAPGTGERVAPSRRARRRRLEGDRGPGTGTVGVSPGLAPAVACEPADDPVGYRFGRWARLALTLTVVATAVVVAVALWPAATPQRLVDVTVGPGDTLWGIAGEVAPDRDPRAVIAEIEELNGLTSAALRVGVVLRVPAGA